MIGIFRSLIWSKTLMKLIFNPHGEFRWSPEGPVSQIHSPHLHVGAPGIFPDFLRSVQMLNREWDAESNGKLPHLFISGKTGSWVCGGRLEFGRIAALVPALRTCPWTEHSDNDDDMFQWCSSADPGKCCFYPLYYLLLLCTFPCFWNYITLAKLIK